MSAIKWVFAFSQSSADNYEAMIRVAVASARAHTAFEAFCLYDGQPCELTRWLETQNVRVVPCRTSFWPQLEKLSHKRGDDSVKSIGSGAFLRLELPRVARELGWSDEFVFYSDCDVMFQNDPAPFLEALRPRVFAVAPEHDRDSPLHMNSGAMWMNLREFGAASAAFCEWTARNFERVWDFAWDQGALRVYFHPLHRALWRLNVPDRLGYGLLTRLPFRSWQWDDLPRELNWKPYWGQNENAALIHFHGPKPTQRAALERGECGPLLQGFAGETFDFYARRWDKWLEEVRG